MTAQGDFDRERLRRIADRERETFVADHPKTMALLERARAHMPNGVPMAWMASDSEPPVYIDRGEGSRFTDVDGHEYVDTNIADISMFCGYANPAIVEAVARRAAAGTQFLLPSEDSVWVAEELARRYPVPKWQFTLSASQANTEVIRVARAATGREVVVLFDGHYHGHFDEGLIDLKDGVLTPAQRGLVKATTSKVRIAQMNDEDGLRGALEPRDVAIVLTEPALTNNIHLLLPEPGWHDTLRAITRETGTVLEYDETHTHVTGPGGLTAHWNLQPDVVTIGKSVAGGIPLGAYGLTEELAAEIDLANPKGEAATGGTLFGNPLSAAAARATLSEVLVSDAYAWTAKLGERLADGIDDAIEANGLPWTTIHFWPRSGQWYGPRPTTGHDARAITDLELTRALRLWLANRGVWEAIPGAGPTISVPASEQDVDRYLEAYAGFLQELSG